MNIDTEKLVQTEFLAFAMKAFATLKRVAALAMTSTSSFLPKHSPASLQARLNGS
jgi:uncharacterized protein with ACT and thioredoxin-like domain